MIEIERDEERIDEYIRALIEIYGADPGSFDGELVTQIIETALRLLSEEHDIGQLKVIARSIREMRYAYRIFNRYRNGPCISIFGSARTPEGHPDYIAAKEFCSLLIKHGWMSITGAANGIMKACVEGHQKEHSFGLSIRLPFETPTNTVIAGDPKLIFFRYFFTRKLMFMSHSHAMAAFPGGVGTHDELFEMITLIQTGKANIIPIVLVEGAGGDFWQQLDQYMKKTLLSHRFISPEDIRLYHLARTPEDGVNHIVHFYSRYHSSRYVKELLVMRLKSPLLSGQIAFLNEKYGSMIETGSLVQGEAFPEESDHRGLPRLIFHHNRKDFSLLRMMIDDINDFA